MKCNTYEIDPLTRGRGFKDVCKITLYVISIPLIMAFITMLIGVLIIKIF